MARLFVSQATVYNYASAYRANSIKGLFYKTSTYSPKRMTKDQEDLLVKTITEGVPADVGFNSKMNWTAPIVRDWIKQEFGIQKVGLARSCIA